jgi:MOSC domain-containing protein YiiM
MTPIDLLTGPVRPLGKDGVASGIDKRPAERPLWLGTSGLDGDAQGDTRHHGGPEKAVHHYALNHYDYWRAQIGERRVLHQAGAFGENVSAIGLTEADVAVGDVFRLGGAIVQVSQGRQPCWKLNLRFDLPDMALRVQTSGRTGWYYRVMEEGWVEPGAMLERIDRTAPEWTIARLCHTFYGDPLNRAELAELATLEQLSETWRHYAVRRLASGTIEDWTRRLYGDLRMS